MKSSRNGIFLFIVLTVALSAASGAEPNLPLRLDCSEPGALRKLEREIRRRKHNGALSIYPHKNEALPELPEHDFRAISVIGHGDWLIDLKPLAGHTPKHLSLYYGTFSNLASLETAKIETLSAFAGGVLQADDLSRGDWASLKDLSLGAVRGEVLDLRSAVKLEELSLYGGNGGIDIRLSPQVRLKELSFDGVHLPLLRSVHTGKLEKLFVFPSGRSVDYAPLAGAELPNLTSLNCYASGVAPCRLPFMPKLKKLDLEKCPGVSLKHIRTQCPVLEHLRLTRIPEVTDWDELSKMPLKRLHVADCGGAKWALPVPAPSGCRVTGLPGFTGNPYKMWSAWAVATLLFGAWTIFRRRKRKNREAQK